MVGFQHRSQRGAYRGSSSTSSTSFFIFAPVLLNLRRRIRHRKIDPEKWNRPRPCFRPSVPAMFSDNLMRRGEPRPAPSPALFECFVVKMDRKYVPRCSGRNARSPRPRPAVNPGRAAALCLLVACGCGCGHDLWTWRRWHSGRRFNRTRLICWRSAKEGQIRETERSAIQYRAALLWTRRSRCMTPQARSRSTSMVGDHVAGVVENFMEAFDGECLRGPAC